MFFLHICSTSYYGDLFAAAAATTCTTDGGDFGDTTLMTIFLQAHTVSRGLEQWRLLGEMRAVRHNVQVPSRASVQILHYNHGRWETIYR